MTFGAGALNMVHLVAAAFAEKSPVVVISGAPVKGEARRGLLLHHQAKALDSQFEIDRQITCRDHRHQGSRRWSKDRRINFWNDPSLVCQCAQSSAKLVDRARQFIVHREIVAPEGIVSTVDTSGHPPAWHDLLNKPPRVTATRHGNALHGDLRRATW